MVRHVSCINCGKCRKVCTHKNCIACGICVEVCPLRLRKIAGEEIETEVLAEKLMKGKEVLVSSGGGITISGGEPLAQPDFLFDLIRQLKPINIAVETSGYANKNVFQKMLTEVDLVLMDVKHTDSVIHKKYTGVDNSLILENLKVLCQSTTNFHIRIPLIPGINDTPTNLEKIAL